MNKESLAEFEKTTMLADSTGDLSKNKYIFGIINEIKRRILNEGEYDYLKERREITSLDDSDITYTNGKVVADKQKTFNMNELMKCTYGKQFEEI